MEHSGIPIQARLFLRRSYGQTILGGQLLADLCPDGIDRIANTRIVLVTVEQWRAYQRGGVQCLAGQNLDQVLTGDAFACTNLDKAGWIRER